MISRYLDILVSWYLGISVSRYLGISVSRFRKSTVLGALQQGGGTVRIPRLATGASPVLPAVVSNGQCAACTLDRDDPSTLIIYVPGVAVSQTHSAPEVTVFRPWEAIQRPHVSAEVLFIDPRDQSTLTEAFQQGTSRDYVNYDYYYNSDTE